MLLILFFFAPLSSEVLFTPSKQKQSVDGTGHQEGILRERKREADRKEPHRLSSLEELLPPTHQQQSVSQVPFLTQRAVSLKSSSQPKIISERVQH